MASLSPEEQMAEFRGRVVAAHPELFAPKVIGTDPTTGASDLDERLTLYLPSLPERAAGIQRAAAELRSTLAAQDSSFRRVFTDMKWSGVVYFTASIDAFDGALREIEQTGGGKQLALLFGIDKIVKIYGAESRVGPLFHHELFHCYHLDVNPSIRSTEDSPGMLEPLWTEGLAVYVASRLNPDATLRELTLSEAMVEAAQPRLAEIAAELRAQLDETTEASYRDFFLGAGKREDLPKRVGYYVGYRVAKHVAERHGGSLPDLARLRRPALRDAVDEALRSLN